MELNNYKKQYEEKVIAGLIYTKRIDIVLEVLQPGDFSQSRFKDIYADFLLAFEGGDKNWYEATKQKYSDRGIKIYEYAGEFGDYVDTEELVIYVGLLRDINKKIKLNYILEEAPGELDKSPSIVDFASNFINRFLKITEEKILNKEEGVLILEKYKRAQNEFQEKKKNGDNLIGKSCGILGLDALTDGLRDGIIWTIGGYSGTGKTFLALNIIAEFVKRKEKVVFFSLEMSDTSIMGRLLSVLSGVNDRRIFKKLEDPEEEKRIKIAEKIIKGGDIKIHTNNNSLRRIKTDMINEYMKGGVKLFVIDYIQLVDAEKGSDYENLKETCESLQVLVGKLGIPMIILSQISNAAAHNPNTRVMGFKGAGEITAISELALVMIPDPDKYPSDKDWIDETKKGGSLFLRLVVGKNRNGSSGSVDVKFTGKIGKFEEI